MYIYICIYIYTHVMYLCIVFVFKYIRRHLCMSTVLKDRAQLFELEGQPRVTVLSAMMIVLSNQPMISCIEPSAEWIQASTGSRQDLPFFLSLPHVKFNQICASCVFFYCGIINLSRHVASFRPCM